MCINNQKGFALPLALIVMVFFVMLSGALIQYSLSENKMSAVDLKKMQAHYIAQSGAESVAAYIINNPLSAKNLINKTTDPRVSLGEGTFAATVTGQADGPLTIFSTGYVNAYSPDREITETVSLSMVPQYTSSGTFPEAIFSNLGFRMDNGTITGDIATNSNVSNCLNLSGNPNIYGDLYIGPEGDPASAVLFPWGEQSTFLHGDVANLSEERTYELPPFPVFPELPPPAEGGPVSNGVLTVGNWPYQNVTISAGAHYTNIKIVSNFTLTIDVGSGESELRVDNLNIESGYIVLQGTGSLKLYVGNSFMLTAGSKVNQNGNPNRLTMYYKGTGAVNPGGDTKFNGLVYVNSADVNITNSGGITGHIVSGGGVVNVSGDASAMVRVLYAPNATVNFTGSGHLKGAIICNNLTMSGGTYVTYDDTNNDTFPYSVGGPSTLSGYRKGLWQ
ncbi:DUF7305 domain-containing protein [Pelotomaculum propionicicum]|uniref:DUF7305 domain-containing protein n=1 Tax=Pelotomaculum propionicicum TaxID=258475 RepID=A0A4Y7RKS4_9FIRM|nr:pilus assembly PilX N-terminal domain-containing protein [Pelotomaculum propionicicum]NLI11365.1 hypothetical protein [Peptococcaceae bacterium]TEB09584.1 hypothetical protein Pmgp_03015 [Pelotomaculum propionicicum]